jgi:hypothetical protein
MDTLFFDESCGQLQLLAAACSDCRARGGSDDEPLANTDQVRRFPLGRVLWVVGQSPSNQIAAFHAHLQPVAASCSQLQPVAATCTRLPLSTPS